MKKITLALFLFASSLAFSQNCNFTVFAVPNPVNPLLLGFGHSFQGTVNSAHWDFGDGDTSNVIGTTHAYAAPGTYIFCLTVNNCPPVCDTLIIPGGADPCAFNIGNSPNPANPLLYGFFHQYGGTINSVHWDFGDGDTSNVAASGTTHAYAAPGVYIYCVTVNNCAPVCDTITTAGANISLNENSEMHLSAYPNPVTDYLNISYNLMGNKNLSLEIYSYAGILVLQQDISGNAGENTKKINLGDLPKGAYILKIMNGESLEQMRIIKQ
jgi:hypothetical protein